MKRYEESKKPRMNKNLCPAEFKIYVPKQCKLLTDWESPTAWERYLRTLTEDHELPDEYDDLEEGWTCDCKRAWVLRGDLAIAHACRVHERIHSQVLGFEQVSAIDVGFAILERQTEFDDFLAIRVHVNKKLPPELLAKQGMTSLTLADYVIQPRKKWDTDKMDDCPNKKHYRRVLEILKGRRKSEKSSARRGGTRRYPIGGVRPEDLSIYCPRDPDETCTLEDIRLCICGVPIDVVNAHYDPSTTHPGGDANSGVFAEPPERSDQLSNDEQLLIGRGRANPLVGGISVGSVTGQAGTLGTVVWDRTDGTPCMLSNWHVLAGNPRAQVNQPIYQPALFDGGTDHDVVAHLKRWHLGEEGDAAIAELSGNRHFASGEILGLWHPISGYQKPRLNMEIRKWGRTTGFTRGFVDGIHLATNIDYGNGVVRRFKGQFHIAPLYAGDDVSQVGDSGSLVVTSFRPVDLARNLEKVCDWLRKCCKAQGGKKLCKEITKTLEQEVKKCDKRCSQLCKDLECALKRFKKCCKDDDLRKLHKLIVKWRKKLTARCQPIIDCARFCTHAEETFGQWLINCKECGTCTSIKKNIDQLIQTCNTLEHGPDNSVCSVLKLARKDLMKLCGGGAKNEALCRSLKKWKKALIKECEPITRCAAICGRVENNFTDWASRCFTERIRITLMESCQESTCKDPSSLIACIEKNLSLHAGAQGKRFGRTRNDKTRQIKKLLQSLVHDESHDPDEFLQSLRGSTKRYRIRKKDGRERDETRVYYAVGLIFAGDTPGSPFGEFAVASDISVLEEKLRFSLRPVFEPRSSFRELRVRPQVQEQLDRAIRSLSGLTPGAQGADPRGGGPQPDIEPAQTDPGSGPGSPGG